MLWMARLNRWGRPEFNATFSSGFCYGMYQLVLGMYYAIVSYHLVPLRISMYSVRTEYRHHEKSTYFRLKVQTVRVTYQYVPVRTECILFCLFSYRLFFISKGYIPGTCWLWWSTYFWFLILLRACRAAQPVCSRAIQAPAHALKQITLKHWQVSTKY